MKCKRKVQVKNDGGLHTRPATAIVQTLQTVKSDVWFSYKNETINARSILSILMLAAKKSSQITITAEGDDADEVVDKLAALFESKFGEK